MNNRQQKILEKLLRLGFISIHEEAAEHRVSTMTIRRDIGFLERQGKAVRCSGGAVPCVPPPGQLSKTENIRPAQQSIARLCLDLIPAAGTVMLSTGSTTLQVARQLAVSDKQVAVLTNSLSVAAALHQTALQVILTGGTLRNQSLDLIGPVTEKNLDEYHIDLLISGCEGAVAEEGFFTSDLNLASLERKSAAKSDRLIVVTESFKFNQRSFVKFADTSQVYAVVSDTRLSEDNRSILRRQGVKVIV